MALTKQVVSVARGTVETVEMSAPEEAAFLAQQAVDEAELIVRRARAANEEELQALRAKLLDVRITAAAADARDLARYAELKAELGLSEASP